MKRYLVILAAAALLTAPALAADDAVPEQVEEAAPSAAPLVFYDEVPVLFDAMLFRPIALATAPVRLALVAVVLPHRLADEARDLGRFVFRDPIGKHRR